LKKSHKEAGVDAVESRGEDRIGQSRRKTRPKLLKKGGCRSGCGANWRMFTAKCALIVTGRVCVGIMVRKLRPKNLEANRKFNALEDRHAIGKSKPILGGTRAHLARRRKKTALGKKKKGEKSPLGGSRGWEV